MKQKFRDIRLSPANKKRLDQINSIIREYQRQGYVLTLRQLYYQLVSRDIIANQVKEYANLSKLLKEGRMAGIVDWDAIEDRLRVPYTPAAFDSPADIMNAAIKQYRKPRMEGQDNYMEVWVEKDALSGVLRRVTKKYHVPILVNRGYSSASAMYDSFNRFLEAFKNDQKVRILYLGDFDPSGMDMIRDIYERIAEFVSGAENFRSDIWDGVDYDEQNEHRNEVYDEKLDDSDVEDLAAARYMRETWLPDNFFVEPIALTREQITRYNPPPNPAKKTDPRSKKFIAQHGASSWEVDALRPEVLNQLLTDAILGHIDEEKFDAVLEAETVDIDHMKKIMSENGWDPDGENNDEEEVDE